MKRTFLVLTPPLQLARKLYSARMELREARKGLRRVNTEHFHITLVFLGERNESVVRKVTVAVCTENR